MGEYKIGKIYDFFKNTDAEIVVQDLNNNETLDFGEKIKIKREDSYVRQIFVQDYLIDNGISHIPVGTNLFELSQYFALLNQTKKMAQESYILEEDLQALRKQAGEAGIEISEVTLQELKTQGHINKANSEIEAALQYSKIGNLEAMETALGKYEHHASITGKDMSIHSVIVREAAYRTDFQRSLFPDQDKLIQASEDIDFHHFATAKGVPVDDIILTYARGYTGNMLAARHYAKEGNQEKMFEHLNAAKEFLKGQDIKKYDEDIAQSIVLICMDAIKNKK